MPSSVKGCHVLPRAVANLTPILCCPKQGLAANRRVWHIGIADGLLNANQAQASLVAKFPCICCVLEPVGISSASSLSIPLPKSTSPTVRTGTGRVAASRGVPSGSVTGGAASCRTRAQVRVAAAQQVVGAVVTGGLHHAVPLDGQHLGVRVQHHLAGHTAT